MKERKNSTKDRIVEQSKLLFDTKGYDNVTINDICKACGISKHTFYYYFKAKEDILKSFYSIKSEFTAKIMMEIMEEKHNINRLWILFEKPLYNLIEMGPETIKRMFVDHMLSDSTPVKEHFLHSEIRAIQEKFLANAKIDQEFNNTSDTEVLLKLLVLQVVSLIQFWVLDGGKDDLISQARSCFEACLDVRSDLRRTNI